MRLLGLTDTVLQTAERHLLLLGIALLALAGAAVLARLAASVLRRRRHRANGVLVLGTNRLAAQVIDEIDGLPDERFRLIGAVEDAETEHAHGVTPILGRLDQFAQIIAATRPAYIVIAMSDRRGRVPGGPLLQLRLQGVIVEDAIDFLERVTGKLAIESLKPSSLILSNEFRHADLIGSRTRRSLWRAGSVIVAALGLVLASPLFVLIALAIKLDSPGPVFFVQDRIGRGGLTFGLVKFRTMRELRGTAPSEWVSENADRITRVGRWLRRFRLDELPQLVNVVTGEMNLIGPRPHPVTNHQLFLRNIPYYGIRSMVLPGITGWAQVRYGYANNLEEETEKMRYDLYYIKHGCLRLDVRIVLETIALLLFDRRSHQAARPTRTWPRTDVKAAS
jgi:exopolysaccharide biosynthesis polyprenyl glycosylphosphotransferase